MPPTGPRLLRGPRGSRGRRRQDEIQRAYRKLARNHPDVNKDPAAEDRFKETSEAYMSCPIRARGAATTRSAPDFRQVPEGVDPETWARARVSARARAEQFRRSQAGDRDWASAGASFFFFFFFFFFFLARTSRPTRAPRPRRASSPRRRGPGGPELGPIPGADQEAEIELDRGGGIPRRAGVRSPALFRATRAGWTSRFPAGVTDGQRIRLAGQGGRGGDGGSPPGTST